MDMSGSFLGGHICEERRLSVDDPEKARKTSAAPGSTHRLSKENRIEHVNQVLTHASHGIRTINPSERCKIEHNDLYKALMMRLGLPDETAVSSLVDQDFVTHITFDSDSQPPSSYISISPSEEKHAVQSWLLNYLKGKGLSAVDVSGGAGCTDGYLYAADIGSLPGMRGSPCYRIQGNTDVVVFMPGEPLAAKYLLITFNLKPVDAFSTPQDIDQALREGVLQLIGTNAGPHWACPVVIVTACTNQHYLCLSGAQLIPTAPHLASRWQSTSPAPMRKTLQLAGAHHPARSVYSAQGAVSVHSVPAIAWLGTETDHRAEVHACLHLEAGFRLMTNICVMVSLYAAMNRSSGRHGLTVDTCLSVAVHALPQKHGQEALSLCLRALAYLDSCQQRNPNRNLHRKPGTAMHSAMNTITTIDISWGTHIYIACIGLALVCFRSAVAPLKSGRATPASGSSASVAVPVLFADDVSLAPTSQE